ncbi:hypothetical protein CSW47_08410 [Thermus scotoductus]|uniref:Uncharacterized protein n=1 Tax=Thermus scotoductus TaxID=37636 RepID=A0A430R8F7_THESC|nr:hypothetical protein [Thermus scotoductus]RTH03705.1 hypothetical protein CSW47_08410 [Thermus scotoductus]
MDKVRETVSRLVPRFLGEVYPEDRDVLVDIGEKHIVITLFLSSDKLQLVYDFSTQLGKIIVVDKEYVYLGDEVEEEREVVKEGILKNSQDQVLFIWIGPGNLPFWVENILTQEGIRVL